MFRAFHPLRHFKLRRDCFILKPDFLQMKAKLRHFLLLAVLGAGFSAAFTSCKSYCPAVDGTGNSASRGTRISLGRSDCPAVRGTGNYKPKVKNKREDGLTSAKMERQIAKANKKKAGPIENKKLSFD
jgi:hypothetical protein